LKTNFEIQYIFNIINTAWVGNSAHVIAWSVRKGVAVDL